MSFAHIFDEGVHKLLLSAKQIAQYSEEQRKIHKKKILKLPLEELLSCLDDYLNGLPDPNSPLPITFSDKILIINCREILNGVSVIFDMEIKSLFQFCKRNVSKKEKSLKLHSSSKALKFPKISEKEKITLDEPLLPIGEEVMPFHDIPQWQISPMGDNALPGMDELRTRGWPVLEDLEVTSFPESIIIPRQKDDSILPQEMPIQREIFDGITSEIGTPEVRKILDVCEQDMLESILAEADKLGSKKRPRATSKTERPLLYLEQHIMSNEVYRNFLHQKSMEVLEAFENAENYIQKRYHGFKRRDEDKGYLSDGLDFDFEGPYDLSLEERLSIEVGAKGSAPVQIEDSLRDENIAADLEVTVQQPSQLAIEVRDSFLDMFSPLEINKGAEKRESPPILREPNLSVNLSHVSPQHSLMTPTTTRIPQRDRIDVSTLSTPHFHKEQLSEDMVLSKLKVLCKLENDFTISFVELCPYFESRLVASVFFELLIRLWGRNQVYLNQISSHPSEIYIRLNISYFSKY